ncbi:hypothetical protein VHUM_00540 [Vanrija humicola]|uniref:Arrestin-like N-terminal domain-containing protein n=1 Tax=Vanrija humicola TaxID=5417 RepID=A0A7D8V582_VANHU|nr:hypothetical protein VHUM_00540 [Vanrija humicola]
MGPRRCRAIRVTLKSVCKLNMGPDRGWEEDVLFERQVEVKGAIILHEGVQRFKFSIIVPFGLGPYDQHPNGGIKLDLFAAVEGLGGRSSTMSPSASPAGTPRRGRSPQRPPARPLTSLSESNSGSSTSAGGSSGTATPPAQEDGTPADVILPHLTVSWNEAVGGGTSSSNLESEIQWLRGTVEASRYITVLYNPDPENGINTLDVRRRGDVGGIGVFEVRLTSNPWTICGLVKIHVSIPDPSPTTTIYYARLLLNQTATITSPRDDPATAVPIVSSTPFVIWDKGHRPPKATPTRDTSAFYRGRSAQGSDAGGLVLSGVGRIPNDEAGRPSTLPIVITPIKVTHSLILEVWYSVYGEDARGMTYDKPQQGQLRVLRVEKPVVLPSCAFIPEVMELPSYESHTFEKEPCKTCRTPPELQACQTCPLTSVPHARHDLPPNLVGNPNGVCPTCEKRFITDDVTGKWMDCACGHSLKDIEERMRTVALQDIDDAGPGTQTPPHVKEEAERRGRPGWQSAPTSAPPSRPRTPPQPQLPTAESLPGSQRGSQPGSQTSSQPSSQPPSQPPSR